MMNLMKKFVKEEEGATMVEYAILVGLLSIVAIVTIGLLGGKILGIFQSAQTALPAAVTPQ